MTIASRALGLLAAFTSLSALAAPTITRLTPPSELFASGEPNPVIARFLPGQRFDLQATVRPDESSKSITSVSFIAGAPNSTAVLASAYWAPSMMLAQ